MIDASYYSGIYLLIVTILTIAVANSYSKRDAISPRGFSDGIDVDFRALLLVIFLTIFIGFRPISGRYFGDTGNYSFMYDMQEGLIYVYDPSAQDIIWDNLFNWWASQRLGISNFFVLVAFIYFGGYLVACRKFFNQDQYIAFLVFLCSFSTYSYSMNGIRAGAAAAIFLVGIAYYKNLWLSIPLVLISLGVHHSMVLPLAAFILSYFYKNIKVYFFVWMACVLIAAVHITFFQTLFATMAEEQGDASGAGYLMSSSADAWGGKAGFRLDFILYSAMPVLVGYIAMYKKKLRLSGTYKFLLSIYLITNSVWMLCMYAAFTNRIAYLSWFMFPIVLVYPFIRENWGADRYKTLSKVVLANLAFTLFMRLIYYNI